MVFQPYHLVSPSPLCLTPGSHPCSLLSGLLILLPTPSQGQGGLFYADNDYFWFLSLSKAFLANVAKTGFVSGMRMSSKSMVVPRPGNVSSEFHLVGQSLLPPSDNSFQTPVLSLLEAASRKLFDTVRP